MAIDVVDPLAAKRNRNSEEGLGDLFDRYYRECVQAARRLLKFERSATAVEDCDLVHEAFLRLSHNRLPPTPETFMGVLTTTMRRVLADSGRARTRKKRAPPATLPLAEAHIPVMDDRALVANSAWFDSLPDRLADLPFRTAAIIIYRCGYDWSATDVAREFGVSVSTVRREIVTGLSRLRRDVVIGRFPRARRGTLAASIASTGQGRQGKPSIHVSPNREEPLGLVLFPEL